MSIQSNLGNRTILFLTKSIFNQKMLNFYVSDFEHKIRVTTKAIKKQLQYS